MAFWATNKEDSVAIANICCLHILQINTIIGWGSAIQCSCVSLVYRRIAIVVFVVEAVDREWVLNLGHSEVSKLPVFLTTATESTITIDTSLHTDTSCGTIHGDVIEPYMLDVLSIATDRSTMACSEVAVPYMDVLCVIVANYIIVTIADITVVDVDVWTPDRDTIRVMRCLALSCF